LHEHKLKTIVFTSTKRGADSLTHSLTREGFQAMSLHGDKSQSERDWVLRQFKGGERYSDPSFLTVLLLMCFHVVA
jgi:superfamily II DNA/RNA helicase